MITFSVVTITYNAASVLQPTLDSVLMQNYPHVEHIIIDGASTDDTLEIAKAYQQQSDEAENEHVVRIQSEPDDGLYDAMNKGVAMATGEWCIFLNAGDTLVLDLPKELGLVTKLEFPIVHENGEVIANAVTDPSTQKVTITFTNYFTENYKDKVMTLKYNVRPNAATLPKTGTYYFTFGSTDFTLNYNKDDGEAGDYEMKYGYQDSENPKRIKWRVVLNAGQDKLNKMGIKDDFSDSGQVLVESSFRAVRYATQPEKIPNEAALL